MSVLSPDVPSRLPSQLRVAPFVVDLDRFHGPLDLLLHLIRSQDIDIFDIPIAVITGQFQSALAASLDRLELERAGEFLELAATLVRIKAQLLLPGSVEHGWEEDPRAELVRRLLEYEYFQEVAHVLSAAENDRARHFGKGYVEPRPVAELARERLDVGLEDFLAAARRIPEPGPEPVHTAPSTVVKVEEKIALVRRIVARRTRLAFRRLFPSWRARAHVVAALLACLELARQQVLRIEQTRHFEAIWLFRGERSDPASGDGRS
ncbi:MAG: segregation and condensation protein A [Gemmatimonadota bacterium]